MSLQCRPASTKSSTEISGPLMDRIDLHIEVPALGTQELLHAPKGEPSAAVRSRSAGARQRALQRQGKLNQALAGQEVQLHAQADPATEQLLQAAALRLGWSARGVHRTLKIARTIADLAGCARVELAHAAEALQYRQTGQLLP